MIKMRELLKKTFRTAIVSLMAVTFLGTCVFASDTTYDDDASGNVFAAGQIVNVADSVTKEIGNELFAAGFDVNANDVTVDGSAFLAGQNVSLKNAKLGGSIFAAGNYVDIDATANNNIWAVGNVINVFEGTDVKALHIAGNSIVVNGEYEIVNVAGSTVNFNAVVSGDVTIEADKVVFGDNAKIDGNLKVISKENPQAEEIANGSYEFEEIKESSDDDEKVGTKVGKSFGKAAFGVFLLKKVKSAVLNLFRYAVLAVLLVFVFKKNLTDSYEFATKKPGKFWGFGALVLICFPIVAIILCITIIGLPVSLLATAFYVMALCVAKVFTFASLGRELIFTHTKKRLHPVAETVLAVLPAAIINVIPIIGGLVGLACSIYMMGYVCLAFAETISSNNKAKQIEE